MVTSYIRRSPVIPLKEFNEPLVLVGSQAFLPRYVPEFLSDIESPETNVISDHDLKREESIKFVLTNDIMTNSILCTEKLPIAEIAPLFFALRNSECRRIHHGSLAGVPLKRTKRIFNIKTVKTTKIEKSIGTRMTRLREYQFFRANHRLTVNDDGKENIVTFFPYSRDTSNLMSRQEALDIMSNYPH